MPSRRRARKRHNQTSVLTDMDREIVVFGGFPRQSLEWIKNRLQGVDALRSARYLGVPSPLNDWGDLYKKDTIAETLALIENTSRSKTPRRIIVLYVPSHDKRSLISALSPVCFLAPMHPQESDMARFDSNVGWRNDKPIVERTVLQTLEDATKATNGLVPEITDKRISPYTLPARNFHYPDRFTAIGGVYRHLAEDMSNFWELGSELLPTRFTRDQLPARAFKGRQNSDQFFEDRRGRIYPPDLYHAPIRSTSKDTSATELSPSLQQRYRFGVPVRNGNLHYDVQFEEPRQLSKEPMHCAVRGDVWVTGSHANVGVNDVIWTNGTIEARE